MVPVPLSIAVNADSLATWFLPLAARASSPVRLVALSEVVTDDQDHTSSPPAARRGGRLHLDRCQGRRGLPGETARRHGVPLLLATPGFVAEFLADGLIGSQRPSRTPAVLCQPQGRATRRVPPATVRHADRPLPAPLPALYPSALLEGIAMGAGYGLVPSTQAQRAGPGGRAAGTGARRPGARSTCTGITGRWSRPSST